MHAGLGGAFAAASGGNALIGALAGGTAEALSGLTSSASTAHAFSGTGESGTGLSNWIDTAVAATSLLAGGSAHDISTATTVSSSVAEYNMALHLLQQQALMTQGLLSATAMDNKEKIDAEPLLPNISFPDSSKAPTVALNLLDSLAEKLNSLGLIDDETASSVKVATIIAQLSTSNVQLVSNNGILENSKHSKGNKSNAKPQEKAVAASGSMDPNKHKKDENNNDDDKYKKYKKKDGSNRYECEKTESPEWEKTKHFKDKYRTNGQKGKDAEYYRWDKYHKDIEIYDDKARYIGSKDPVTGKIYRIGDMRVSNQLKSILK